MESTGRSRRQLSKEASKKADAFEKLRALKGKKHKIEIEEDEDIYEVVEEEEYAKRVTDRQKDDWIVHDGSGEYADNGREVFDDEYDDDYEADDRQVSATKKKAKYSIKGSRKEVVQETRKGDIRSMLSSKRTTISISKTANGRGSLSMSSKNIEDVTLDESAIEDMMDSISSKTSKTPHLTPQPLKMQRKQQTPSSLNRSTASKRKSDGTSPLASTNYLPPHKRRLTIKQEFDFGDINEDATSTEKENEDDNRNPMANSKKSSAGDKPKLEVLDGDFDDFDDDFMLPDNSAMNDFDGANDMKVAKNALSMPKNVKMEDTGEEWIFSDNNMAFANEAKSSAAFVSKEIMFETDDNKDKWINFYWLDAWTDTVRSSDVIYLFGKIWIQDQNRFVSASVLVRNAQKRVLVLPREHPLDDKLKKVTLEDVHSEFSERVAKRMRIDQFKCRKVVKKYAFDLPGVPEQGKYLEVLYSAKHDNIPGHLQQGNTYKYIFGANTSPLENLILDLKLKGPQWLKIKNPVVNEPGVTWSKIELSVDGRKQIVIDEVNDLSPELTVLSLNVKTFVNQQTKQNEIIAISCLVKNNFRFDMANPNHHSSEIKKTGEIDKKYDQHFCIVTKPSGKAIELPIDFDVNLALKSYDKTHIYKINSEREMLNFFLAKLSQVDPDVIAGHDVFGFDYDLLLSRFQHYQIQNIWSKLGRLKRSGKITRTKEKHNLAGRIVCDVKIIAKELTHMKSYDLSELSVQILKKGRFEVDQQTLPNYYQSSKQLIRLVELLMKDNDLALSIMYELACLPLAKQITNISGNLLSKTLLGGRAERNEYLLLHAFNEQGYVVPDKEDRFGNANANKHMKVSAKPTLEDDLMGDMLEDLDDDGGKGKATKKGAKKNASSYAGGLVLEPKVGFYDKFILLMDFNSLYPSIIQEFNICFTTIKPKKGTEDSPQEMALLLDDRENWPEGILPREIKKLVDSRKEVKRKLFDQTLTPEERIQLDIKQKALKISANSMYGCLGFQFSRFYGKHLAALVTYKGREILQKTKEMVERIELKNSERYDVIYGDTDSIMVQTNCGTYEEVKKAGMLIKNAINKEYKLLEIDIDGVFRCMLLLKKKKYAALTMSMGNNGQPNYKSEIKGLDIVRRDWSMLSKQAGEEVINKILVPDKPIELIVDDIHNYLKDVAEKVKNNELPLEEFVINKALAKKPEDYHDSKMTHVDVALRYNKTNLDKPLRAGDTVPFIICQDGSKNAAPQRGYHIDEVRNDSEGELKVDTYYYLSQQLLPVVSRLCEPLDGTDTAIIAEILGVEAAVKRSVHQIKAETDPALNSGDQRFDICPSLMFKCPKCSHDFGVRDLFKVWNKKVAEIGKLDSKQLLDNRELFSVTFDSCEQCRVPYGDRFYLHFELQLRKELNKFVNEFYHKEMYCEDSACKNRTRYEQGAINNDKFIQCSKCRQGNLQYEMSEHLLYQQLSFACHIFDLEKALSRFVSLELSDTQKAQRKHIKDQYGSFFERLRGVAQSYLNNSSYNEFDLGYLFRKFRYKC